VLNSADDIDWVSLDRCYYDATDDVPGVLRAVASDDEGIADQAFEALSGWISHQGDIYQTTTACIPFLVELARIARHHRPDLIWTVGYVADPSRTHGPEHYPIRAAVARSAAGIARLVDDDDPAVRANAVYALAQCGDRCPVEVLWHRWAVERDEAVQASLLIALAERDPASAEQVLTSALLGGSPGTQLASAVGIQRAGLDWHADAADVLAGLIIDGVDLHLPWFLGDRAVDCVIEGAADDSFVVDALTKAFRSAPPRQPEGRPKFAPAVGAQSAIFAVEARCRASRRGPHRLAYLLRPLLRGPDPELRGSALWCLADIGTAAAEHADLLAEFAGRAAPTDSIEIPQNVVATRTLIRLADPRWVAPLCTMWSTGRHVDLGTSPWRMYRPSHGNLIAEVGVHLQTAVDPTVVGQLAYFAAATGTAAADLEAPLRGARPLADAAVLEALVRIGRATDAEVLDAVAVRAPYRHTDLYAGIELCRRTGEIAPLADAVAHHNDHPEFALRQLLPIANHLTAHTQLLHPFVHKDGDRPTTQHVLAARALLHAGERDPAEAIIRDALREKWVGADAAELAAELHDPALEPDLRALLADRNSAIGAATALVALGAPPEQFVDVLHRWLRGTWTVDPDDIQRRCQTLACTATSALINELAESNERTISGGEIGLTIWEDELMQQTLNTINYQLTPS
jgi:hypothetical protein